MNPIINGIRIRIDSKQTRTGEPRKASINSYPESTRRSELILLASRQKRICDKKPRDGGIGEIGSVGDCF